MQDLQSAMRRSGQNPTESEVQDMINKIDDGTASISFKDFCKLMGEKTKEIDPETHFKDTFRVFSKDEEGELVEVVPPGDVDDTVQGVYQLGRCSLYLRTYQATSASWRYRRWWKLLTGMGMERSASLNLGK